MSKDGESEKDAESPLSDSERLANLEKARRLDRLLLAGVALLLMMVLASWLTASLLAPADEPPTISAAQVEALEQRILGLEQQMLALAKQQRQLEQQPSAPPASAAAAAAAGMDAKDLALIIQTLQGQEQGYQQSLMALKAGMRELAGMVRGSRSWLDHYDEALNQPLAASRKRLERLQQWAPPAPAKAAEAGAAATVTP